MKDLKYLQLWDAYNPLLTEHQREICELYYLCDLSLTEIAEQKGISKQSVSDTLAKSRALLDEYEGKLHYCGMNEEVSLEVSGMLTRTLRALEAMRERHPALAGEIDAIIDLMQIDGEHIATVTTRQGKE